MVISGIDEKMEKSSNRRKHFYANSSSNAFASFRSRFRISSFLSGNDCPSGRIPLSARWVRFAMLLP
jgi:hypothetical protein